MRTFWYFCAAMAATVALRSKVYFMLSSMLDCPEQNHTSPNVSPPMVVAVAFAQPAHDRVAEYSPPALYAFGSVTFHIPSTTGARSASSTTPRSRVVPLSFSETALPPGA